MKFSTTNIEGKTTKGNHLCLECCGLFKNKRQYEKHKCPAKEKKK